MAAPSFRDGIFKIIRIEPVAQRVVGVLIDGLTHQIDQPRSPRLNPFGRVIGIHPPMDVPRESISVGLDIKQSSVQDSVVFEVPAVDVAVRPFTKPLNASGVVHVIRDVHQPAVGGALVQLKVVLVPNVIVPMAEEDFTSRSFEVGIDIENGFQRTGQLVHWRVVKDINELG